MVNRDYIARHEALPGPLPTVTVDAPLSGRGKRRIVLFLLLFLLAAAAGLVYTYSRPAVYQTAAVLLLTPPVSAALPGSAGATAAPAAGMEAGERYTAIQRQVLVSEPVLAQFGAAGGALRASLSVVSLTDPTLLELRATGAEPERLPGLIEDWIAAYLAYFEAEEVAVADSALTTLEAEQTALQARLAAKRGELEAFRMTHGIVSLERDENTILSRIKGLNQALNQASSEIATADAQLTALRAAVAADQPLPPGVADPVLAELERRAAEIRGQLKGLEDRFTPAYMALDPDIVAMTRYLEQLDSDIQQRRQSSRQTAVATAEQALISARRRADSLEAELARYREQAHVFSARYAEYAALQAELEQLEASYREAQARLLNESVARARTAPQVKVLDRPYLPQQPLYPHYSRDAALSVGAALLVGLLGVLFYDFFTRSPPSPVAPVPWPVLYAVGATPGTPAAGLAGPAPAASLEPPPPLARLPATTPESGGRELGDSEMIRLLDTAAAADRLLLALLLNGLSSDELAELDTAALDLAAGTVTLGDRVLPLVEPLLRWLRAGELPPGPLLRDRRGRPCTPAELDARLLDLAIDAGLAHPDTVTAANVRHTYLLFLARQGLRSGELRRLAGTLPAAELAAYRALSPAGRALTLEEVQPVYPPLWNLH